MHLLTSTLQALSLLAWYLDSPPTAHHALHLANCSSLSLTCLAESRQALHAFQQQQADEYFAKSEEARGREEEKEKEKQDVVVVAKGDEVVQVKISGEGNVSIRVDPEELEGLDIWFSDGRVRARVGRGVFRMGGEGNETGGVDGVDAPGVEGQKAGPVLPDGLGRKVENGTKWVCVQVRVQGVGWVVALAGLMCVYFVHYLLYVVGKLVWRCCGGVGDVGRQAVGARREASCDTVDDAGATVDLEEDDDEEKVGWPCGGDEETEPQSVGAHGETSPCVVEDAGSTAVLEEDKDEAEVERESAD
ncbi:hypothetical protein GRF29_161g301401 [Pseudopithomyces chartarum]|uniref:Uncharacterized protein n=1 Tax=Pseudopithomyces chartarum TaxID=1892770 RepID=A0AAN6RFL2_9PLEO|nr:hypothetical protein GRF29_161g301401 [Pseudopithomyces chartarum]